MDITEYLNSKTVAEHFQKIGFQGSAFEQAYLISRSFRHSLEQKQHAWAELINSSSDYAVWDTLMPRYPITLQDLLHEITRVQNVYLEQFFRLEDALFECKILKSGGYSDSDYNVEKLSAEIGMSRGHLYRKVKELTGFSPVEFLRNYRLKRAAEILKQKSMTVSEACYATGFSSPAYFTKCFREYFNMTPTEYAAS